MNTLNILICVGLQNDLISGNHSTTESSKIIQNIINKINTFNGIIFSINVCNLDGTYQNSLEYKYDNVLYCEQFTDGYDVPSEIMSALENKIYFGNTETSLMSTDDIVLKIQELRFYNDPEFHIHIIGFNTDNRVINTALLLRKSFGNTEIYIDSSCCAGTSPEAHNAALVVAKSNYIHVLNSPEVEDIK